MISFEDFKKIDLKIGKVMFAEKISGSDKLIKLQIDLGEKDVGDNSGLRQIIAGIGKFYEPENLVGREIVVVANLEPRMLMGFESRGMLLAAEDDGVVLLRPDKEMSPGSSIH
ncbi:MAG: methionine--tRNA ligase subunit beta [Patescibacteria group bacterium]|nr:methionine--tRNA ligase subunit beta [Patescibacteria group bacterium]